MFARDIRFPASFLLALCAVFLTACEPQRNVVMEGDVSGRWHGARWDGSARVLWLIDQRADGVVEVLFYTCFAGKIVRTEMQSGTAHFRDGIYRTSIDKIVSGDEEWLAEDTEAPAVNAYEVSELRANSMRYRDTATGTRFEVERVEADFAMTCPPARTVVNTSPGGRSGRDAWIRRGVKEEEEQGTPE